MRPGAQIVAQLGNQSARRYHARAANTHRTYIRGRRRERIEIVAIDQNIRQLIYDAMVSAPTGWWTQVDAIIAALKEVGLDLDDYYMEIPPPAQRRLVKRPPLNHPSDIMKDQMDSFRTRIYDDLEYMDEDGGYDAYVGLGGTE